ncbi:MAG: hypothetical protein O6945_05220, partial [Gammaproteobacteria bacterium]|nr:hypothetical protein [Gammaproteobacteria bacterium]
LALALAFTFFVTLAFALVFTLDLVLALAFTFVLALTLVLAFAFTLALTFALGFLAFADLDFALREAFAFAATFFRFAAIGSSSSLCHENSGFKSSGEHYQIISVSPSSNYP